MKGKILKLAFTTAALVIFTGALIFFCGFTVGRGRLPRGVTVNGVCVGGLNITKAKAVLRGQVLDELKTKRLHICADERVYTYSYPEIDFQDDLDNLLPQIKRGGDFVSPVRYYLNGADEIAENLCADAYRAPVEPYATFNLAGEPFTYYDGADGAECDKERLLQDISASVNGGFEDVRICKRVLKRQLSRTDVEERTRKLYSFTTYFDGDNTDRTANIRLAAQKINGTEVKSGETFSFNGVVGARTEQNGFRPAKIIEDGKFVVGYGGGVCQVSTTLYNAALLSGLEIEEYHPHSLQVSYVPPSRDAMVSGNYFDLKFKNNRLTPIYVRVSCNLSSVTCTVYGQPDGYEYSFSSCVTETVPRPEATVLEGDEDGVVSYGRDGILSEGYLVRSRGGETTSELIRKDKYSAVADVLRVKKREEDGEELS